MLLTDQRSSSARNATSMLVQGPVAWAETSIRAGNKLDLLQHAYNPGLGVAAFPRDASVVLVQYSNESGAGDEVIETVKDEIMLHPEPRESNDAKPDPYRYIAWSSSESVYSLTLKNSAYVAVATVARVEVWRVCLDPSVHAVLIGTFSKHRIRGVAWHPIIEAVLVFNDVELDLLSISDGGHLRVQPMEQLSDQREQTKYCSWSPCGQILARASENAIRFYSWVSVADVGVESPTESTYRVHSPSPTPLLELEAKLGSIAAIRMLSSSVCVVVTDTPLVLSDIKDTNTHASQAPTNPPFQSATTNAPSSNVIDLTSLRITASSKSSLLNILDRPVPVCNKSIPTPKRTSHLSIVVRNSVGEWNRYAIVPLEQLAIPDIIDVEAMRVVVGSTISNRLVAIHLDHTLKSGWSASVSGEMGLPDDHVCRGLRLAKTSPFVQVASTEKIKRTFFNTTSGPQRIQLSKFKVPRRRRDTDRKSLIETGPARPRVTDPSTPKASENAPTSPSTVDALATLLLRVEALQSLMVQRFDHVEQRLDDVTDRLTRLEVQKGNGSAC